MVGFYDDGDCCLAESGKRQATKRFALPDTIGDELKSSSL